MKETNLTAAAYDCFIGIFNILGIKKWRAKLWNEVKGPRILDAGAGTGFNIPYYQPGWRIVALDKSELFLERARRRALGKNVEIEFVLGDVQELPYEEAAFDSAISTFLLCQLNHPRKALKELHRVLKPGGQLLLLEHVRSQGGWGRLMDSLSTPIYRVCGDHIARDPVLLVKECGFRIIKKENLLMDVVKFIKIEKGEAF
ncbi:MAG: class I SAM-dependent methyltransferase [Bacillota bacterium]